MPDLLLVGKVDGVLGKLAAAVGRLNPDWSILQIADGHAALEHVEHRSTDLVLASLGDQPVAYEQLFVDVAEKSTNTIRMAMMPSTAGVPPRIAHAHQVLAVRDNLEYLSPVLTAAAEVSGRMRNHVRLEHIICNLQDVPSPPTLYFDIREALENPTGDHALMAEITSKDPSLVARVLKIANSGFYALPRSVSDLSEAIGLIGLDALLGLVLAAHLYSGLPPPGLKLELLWQHTMQVSLLAREITRMEGGNRNDQGQSAVAGLLHDIGLMVLLENEAGRYQPLWRRSRGDELELAVMEREAFGVTHGELGALILMLWNLPDAVVDAVANSHAPAEVLNEQGKELSLTSQSVLAAEWLLDETGNRSLSEPPHTLDLVPADKLENWKLLRDELASEMSAL